MPYNGATICANGHVVSKYNANHQRYCSTCGELTFSQCPKCNSVIRGLWDNPGVFVVGNRLYKKPYYCYNCSAPYPWTQKILNNAVELLSLDNDLDEDSKEIIKNAIPDLIVDTISTPIAVANYKKVMNKAGQLVRGSLRQLLIDAVSESTKKLLFH